MGCGTGALSRIIFDHGLPNAIKGIDSSADLGLCRQNGADALLLGRRLRANPTGRRFWAGKAQHRAMPCR